MIDPNILIETDKKTGRRRVRTVNPLPSLTNQSFEKECDINNIIRRYETTGEIHSRNSKVGRYSDFSEITSYQEMLETVRYADEAFSSLPALVRQRFSNDPQQLLTFLQDPSNTDEAAKLGLLTLTPNPQTQNAKTPTPPVPPSPSLNPNSPTP